MSHNEQKWPHLRIGSSVFMSVVMETRDDINRVKVLPTKGKSLLLQYVPNTSNINK